MSSIGPSACVVNDLTYLNLTYVSSTDFSCSAVTPAISTTLSAISGDCLSRSASVSSIGPQSAHVVNDITYLNLDTSSTSVTSAANVTSARLTTTAKCVISVMSDMNVISASSVTSTATSSAGSIGPTQSARVVNDITYSNIIYKTGKNYNNDYNDEVANITIIIMEVLFNYYYIYLITTIFIELLLYLLNYYYIYLITTALYAHNQVKRIYIYCLRPRSHLLS